MSYSSIFIDHDSLPMAVCDLPFEGTLPMFADIVAKKYAEFLHKHQEAAQKVGMGAYPISDLTECQIFAEEVVYNLMRVITLGSDIDLPANDPVQAIWNEFEDVEDMPSEGPVSTETRRNDCGWLGLLPSLYGYRNSKMILSKYVTNLEDSRAEYAHESSAYKILKGDLGWDCFSLTEIILPTIDKEDRKSVQDKIKARWWTEGDSPKLKPAAIFDLLNAADCMLLLTPSYLEATREG